MAGFRIEGSTSGNVAEVDASNQMLIRPERDILTNPDNGGGVFAYIENDAGYITGNKVILPPEIDLDYRTRIAQDLLLDEETVCYTAQNTGKAAYSNTTMTNAWTAGTGITTNSSSITTTTTGTQYATYAFFPMIGSNTLSIDCSVAFSTAPTTNTFIEFGVGIAGTATTAPGDGVFLRLTSAGLQGIISSNGTETSTGIFPLTGGTGTWAYTNNKTYQFIIYAGAVAANFWVNDGTGGVLLGSIPMPAGQGRISMSGSGQFFHKHRITGGAAGGVFQSFLRAYAVRLGGGNFATAPLTAGSRLLGSYQGLSGGTMGSLANYANSANPTAAVPTNTTAALGTGLGGQFWETASLAVNTDGIIASYQVPAATVNSPGRRLVIRGVGLTSYIQTVIAGGPFVSQWSLAFGHTAVSLATAEAATTKAPRRIALSAFTQLVTAAQAVSTMVSQPGGSYVDFGDAPIFVNPGEFVQLVTKHVGTVGTTGTIAHVVTFVYGWE